MAVNKYHNSPDEDLPGCEKIDDLLANTGDVVRYLGHTWKVEYAKYAYNTPKKYINKSNAFYKLTRFEYGISEINAYVKNEDFGKDTNKVNVIVSNFEKQMLTNENQIIYSDAYKEMIGKSND